MRKVLVLEDEANIRGFIVINLRRAGYEVIEAESGEEALEKLQENPDTRVALLDIMLPKIDGFGVCAQIRRQSQVPILMLTALDGETQQLRGFYTVLFGPFLKVDIVQQAAHGPKIGFLAVAQVVGKPAHYRLHSQCVLDVKGLLIWLLYTSPSPRDCS